MTILLVARPADLMIHWVSAMMYMPRIDRHYSLQRTGRQVCGGFSLPCPRIAPEEPTGPQNFPFLPLPWRSCRKWRFRDHIATTQKKTT